MLWKCLLSAGGECREHRTCGCGSYLCRVPSVPPLLPATMLCRLCGKRQFSRDAMGSVLSIADVDACSKISLNISVEKSALQQCGQFSKITFSNLVTSSPEGCKVLWWVCLSVCLSVLLSTRITRKLHGRSSPNFYACSLRPWLGPPLVDAAIRYVFPVSWMTVHFHTMTLCVYY